MADFRKGRAAMIGEAMMEVSGSDHHRIAAAVYFSR